MNENEKVQFRSYLVKEFESLDDILTIKEVSKFTGLSCKTISRKCTNGDLFSFLINGKRLIPKICLIEYLI